MTTLTQILSDLGYPILTDDEDGITVLVSDEDTEAAERLRKELGDGYAIEETGDSYPTSDGRAYEVLIRPVIVGHRA